MVDQKYSSPLSNNEDIISTSGNLIAGYQPLAQNHTIDIFLTDIRIWNIALPNDVVAKYGCYVDLPSSHPNYNDLKGYWTVREGAGSTIIDHSPNGQNGVLEGSYSWSSFSDLSNAICPTPTDSYYRGGLNVVDVPLQVYQWLNVNVDNSWQLDSKFWTTNYLNLQ